MVIWKVPRATLVVPSLIETATAVEPLALAAGVKVNVPEALMAGPLAKSDGSTGMAVMDTVCPDSSGGPGVMPVTRPGSVASPESSATVKVTVSRVPVGGSLVPLMAMVNEPRPTLVEPSLISTATDVEPVALAAGVKVRVPAALIVGPDANKAALPGVRSKEMVWPDSSAGPGEMLVTRPGSVACPESSETLIGVWSRVPEGGSLTALTEMLTVAGAELSCPSSAEYVKLSGPL